MTAPQPDIHSLRYHRRHQLVSQRDLAKKAGVTASTVYLIETGKSEPTLHTMRQLCLALKVPPECISEFREILGIDVSWGGTA